MSLNNKILQKTGFYSIIFGAGLSIFALIPVFMPAITLFIIPFLCAPVTFFALKKTNILSNLEMRDYSILGGVSGAAGGGVFLVLFCPMVLILHFFVKSYYTYGINFLNLFLLFILFLSIVSIYFITNVATGLLTGFLLKYFE